MTLLQAIGKVCTKDEVESFRELRERIRKDPAFKKHIRYNIERRSERSFSWVFAGLFDWGKAGDEETWKGIYRKLLANGY